MSAPCVPMKLRGLTQVAAFTNKRASTPGHYSDPLESRRQSRFIGPPSGRDPVPACRLRSTHEDEDEDADLSPWARTMRFSELLGPWRYGLYNTAIAKSHDSRPTAPAATFRQMDLEIAGTQSPASTACSSTTVTGRTARSSQCDQR